MTLHAQHTQLVSTSLCDDDITYQRLSNQATRTTTQRETKHGARASHRTHNMSHYKTCSVGLTIFNRSDWADNIDQAFMGMRYQELLGRLSTPRREWRCQDSGEEGLTRG